MVGLTPPSDDPGERDLDETSCTAGTLGGLSLRFVGDDYSSMIVPCMVNSWLYCSLDKNCNPGTASSVRINNAISPPAKNVAKQATMYMIPIVL